MARRARRQAGRCLERRRHHPRLRHRSPTARPTWSSSAPAAIRRPSTTAPRSPGCGDSPASGVAIGGISGGPYVLARAGLLDGRRATLHWEHAPAFREAFPDVEVVPSLFEIDGDRITCSGGVSALDMMVALIARDHGRELAASVGDWFLHTHIREGMGPQRMDLRYRLGVTDEKLLGVLRAMEANLETPLPRAALARAAGVSLRQLERLFRHHLGRGIHAHYRCLRLDRARQLSARPRCRCSTWRRDRLRLGEPVQPRLSAGLRRAAERDSTRTDAAETCAEAALRPNMLGVFGPIR